MAIGRESRVDGEEPVDTIDFYFHADGKLRKKSVPKEWALEWATESLTRETTQKNFWWHAFENAQRLLDDHDTHLARWIKHVYRIVKVESLELWIAENPGTRPNAHWWMTLMRDPKMGMRRVVQGKARRVPFSCYRGMSLLLNDFEPGDIYFESEPTALERFGLLTPGEKKRIPPELWEPVKHQPWKENRERIDAIKAEMRAANEARLRADE